jgi:hypothetical protein
MLIKVVGKQRPFWDGHLRNKGDIFDVPAAIAKGGTWRGNKIKAASWAEEYIESDPDDEAKPDPDD